MIGFICRVCHKCGEITDLTRSSRNVVDSAIFVALATGLGLCREERAKNFYRELRLQCGYVCMQHFHDTAQSLYDEMIATRGSFPDIVPSTSAGSDTETCARIRPYYYAFSTDILRGVRRVVKEIDESVKICQTDLIRYISKAKEKGYIRDKSCDSKSLEPAKRLKWKKYDDDPPLLQKRFGNCGPHDQPPPFQTSIPRSCDSATSQNCVSQGIAAAFGDL
ncbi:hypothetical protein GCK32_004895 [Trichostrongylus colubriformis]|uniref:Uncharacterized protein n=1 Tax=Trichostrongylus colubriformis TaxID=6319 RepID=A0AAN8IWG2_TRICO